MFDVLKSPVEKNIGYAFKNKQFLIEAMTHKSFCVDSNQGIPDFERLEFLGDSILNFIIAEDLFKIYPQDNEGLLSKKRASLVNQNTLNQLALNCHLEDEIILGSGERKQNSHLKPRVLASCFEAIVGAVYLDSNYQVTQSFVMSHFKKLNFKLDQESGFETDYKTRLQEITQKYKMGTPTYEIVMTMGPPHQPSFLVALKLNNEEKTRAEGSSKKRAEQLAAEFYLTILKNEKKS
ncbi:MAG: ribonuclease III [Bdellovibrionales bacterium RIFCSPHIGHO2_01_FULL_40_29]|nr:MAG: ribonuclease III [Bdellovibrionales bacterium RIFCSPHIGHO2_01_FULL_40_29]OFZ34374.1 MAG: ribonuclease III [Bdellovibrionales bacterium RIFCSPHIGHO2_02_FULL_40_15]